MATPNFKLNPNNIFSVVLETKLSRILTDTKPADSKPNRFNYTHDQALTRYKEIMGSDKNTQFNTFSQNDKFTFNNYIADGKYFQNEDTSIYTKEYSLGRNLSNDYPAFKDIVGGETKYNASKNKIKIVLNPRIPRKGFNVGDDNKIIADRDKRKSTLLGILNKHPNNKTNFRRIVKIMAFILGRERGSLFDTAPGGKYFEELMHREYALICCAIVNAADQGKFKCNHDILQLLKDLNYSNPDRHVNAGDTEVAIQSETKIMKKIYEERVDNLNLELFVMAFWDGYINDELGNYTNWDHIVDGKKTYDAQGKKKNNPFIFRGFHLPRSVKGQLDPDAVLDFDMEYNLTSDLENADPRKLTIKNSHIDIFKISKTSNGDAFTLDGRVIFTHN